MPAQAQVDGERDQAERSGQSGRSEGFETEHRTTRRLDDGSRRRRIDGMHQQRDNSLKQTQRFVGIGRLRRGLRVGIRGKRREAGEDNSTESHQLYFSTRYCCRPAGKISNMESRRARVTYGGGL